jgi:hypothetical protein
MKKNKRQKRQKDVLTMFDPRKKMKGKYIMRARTLPPFPRQRCAAAISLLVHQCIQARSTNTKREMENEERRLGYSNNISIATPPLCLA